MLIPMQPQPYQGGNVTISGKFPCLFLSYLSSDRATNVMFCLTQLLFIPLTNFACSKAANQWTHIVHTLFVSSVHNIIFWKSSMFLNVAAIRFFLLLKPSGKNRRLTFAGVICYNLKMDIELLEHFVYYR